MAGETSLTTLLRSMSPQLNAGEYVFCTLRDGQLPSGVEIVGSFREQEGLTVILERSQLNTPGSLSIMWRRGSPSMCIRRSKPLASPPRSPARWARPESVAT